MCLKSILGVLSPVHIGLVTFFSRAKKIGVDPSGNKYYQTKPRSGYKHNRRWVIYKGTPEATKVPPEWHGWLHHQTDIIPDTNEASFRRVWQKPHKPNLTGTDQAYRPPGHILSGGKREKATGDYEAWVPSDKN